jgi:hypothetical protein
LREEFELRLGNTIPNYEKKAKQLFDLFSADYGVEIVDSTRPMPSPKPPAKVDLGAGGEALLERLPKLPPGKLKTARSTR